MRILTNKILSKIIKFDAITSVIAPLKVFKTTICFTNGCFDILHAGHIKTLEFSAKFSHKLIVGINSDASVKRLKGENRPINNQLNRAYLLASLIMVDYVIIFEEDTPLELIKIISPDVLVKGGDYLADSIVGADWVTSYGGEIHICPLLEGYSTTSIIEKA